nr:MAG TPA: Receptor Binding Protein [Caudoviricetes sp.]
MRYAYFDSEITGVDEEGMPIFDRAENSEMFALIFAKLITNGVLAQPADCFQVLAASGSGLTVEVQPGFGMINGRFAYEVAKTTLTLETAPTQYSRIDRIVLRCNYLERLIEIIVKTGAPAASPQAPALLQPASGDYYELGLATVQVAANQTALTQSAITDTRADSSVCGYVTQLIDYLDTETFFAQFNQFYAEFVEKSNQSYDKFNEMAETAFNSYTNAIDEYIAGLEQKGNSDLTDIVESMKEFQRQQQNTFNEWFADIKGQLSEDAAGKLQNEVDDHEARLSALERMIIKNQFNAPIALDSDDIVLVDDDDNAISADWKYKEM